MTSRPPPPPPFSLDLSTLNEAQRAAVSHGDGPLVVFAGAGSGKTRVITYRIARLVSEQQVPPWRILAVTFTNKAAGEMRQRLSSLVPGAAEDLWVGTFHAICARLLRRYAELAGVRPSFVIYDDSDQKAMLTRILRDLGYDERRYHPRLVAGFINRAKQEGQGVAEFEPGNDFERVIHSIYETYDQRMSAAGALDFGDLIYRMYAGMESSPELRAELQRRFSHVLVDEYQDTNRVQYLLVRQLCEGHRNLCVVGDDDQSIYRWRGADRRNILEFTRHFPDARLVKLEQNYRSTKRILRVANAVVSRNVEREAKSLWTDNDEGPKVTLICCQDERDEASLLVKTVGVLLEAGLARREIALLYRTHAQSRVIEEALRRADLPYRVIGGVRFYDRAEIKDLLCYLRVLHNPDDDVSLLRVINTPPRGIGKTAVGRLLDAAARQGTSVFSALEGAPSDPAQAPAARRRLSEFLELMQSLRDAAAAGEEPHALSEQVLERTGYSEVLEAEDSAEADARLQNLREAIGSMIEFERETPDASLATFLELVSLQTDVDRIDESDALTLMTIHAAKGLEYPVVMVSGLEEETFPNIRRDSEDEFEDLEEERRLAYVAFTRAETHLFLSYAQARRVYGELLPRRRSRFIEEMPAEELQVVGAARGSTRRDSGRGHRGFSAHSRPPLAARSAGYEDSYVDVSEASEGAPLGRGARVRHRTFGIGEVLAVINASPPRVTVFFPSVGEKRVLTSHLMPA